MEQGGFIGMDVSPRPPRRDDFTDFFFGVSGGKDSQALMLWALHESGYPRDRLHFVFSDTGNENSETIDHVVYLSRTLHPITTLYPDLAFFALAENRKRFPSTKARFCTEALKMWPAKKYIDALRSRGCKVLVHSGVRAEESEDRANLMPFQWDGYYGCQVYRPMLGWTLAETLAYSQRRGVPLNPLYAAGASRVGCWPCVMCRKAEIRLVAQRTPEVINQIREKEKTVGTFFPPEKVPLRFRSHEVTTEDGRKVMCPTIDDVVAWSMTGKNAQGSYEDVEDFDAGQCSSSLGHCE